MDEITLRHMHYFLALVQTGQFGRAAALSSISQPALSMKIKELETRLGLPLIERNGKKIHITAHGHDVAARFQRIIHDMAELQDFTRAAQHNLSGTLRLGVIPTVAPYLLPHIITTMRKTHPDITLWPREAITLTLLDDLRYGRLDAAIVALPIAETGMTEAPLLDEEFVLVRPARDKHTAPISYESIGEMNLLLLEEGHCFRDQALSFCQLPAAKKQNLIEGNSLTTLVQMVGAGIGVTVIPDMAIPIETKSAKVTITRFATPAPRRTIGMIWRQSSPLARHLERIADALRNSVL